MRATRRTEYFPLKGGEDLETPLFSKAPGSLSASKNFECDSGGRYRRIQGYERFDGHDSPSEASYWIVDFKTSDTEVTTGETVTDLTSGASGEALIDGVLESGSYAGGDATGYYVLGNVSGDFAVSDTLQVSAVTVSIADSSDRENAATSENNLTWKYAAIEAARDKISVVPGSGDILGVCSLNYIKYAFRTNAGDTATEMYKSSSAGWVKVDLGEIIYFDAGTAEFVVGETLAGSVGTGTIKRVIVQSGDWSTSDAAGYIILHSVSNDYVDNETITSASGSADANGVNTAITLTKDGKYDFRVHNFYGHSSTKRIYGCDGVNNGFEFDGTTYTPIFTGMTSDAPQHVAIFKGTLVFTFQGGSIQNSSIGEPTEWSAITGASEIGLGDEIVGIENAQGDTLAIIGESKVSMLYDDGTSWVLKVFSEKFGGVERSLQRGTDVYFLNAAGISSISSTDAYGDFESAPISSRIKPLLKSKLSGFLSSISVRNKEQYRIYFSDKTGINLTFDGDKPIGFTQLTYDHKVCCVWESTNSDGNDEFMFGSDNGMVYHLDKGNTFDGEAIECFLRTWMVTLKNPERKKRFLKIAIEKDDSTTEGYWDIGSWGSFQWDLQRYTTPVSYLGNVGSGYEYGYYANDLYIEPYTLQGVIIHYSNGGLNR